MHLQKTMKPGQLQTHNCAMTYYSQLQQHCNNTAIHLQYICTIYSCCRYFDDKP